MTDEAPPARDVRGTVRNLPLRLTSKRKDGRAWISTYVRRLSFAPIMQRYDARDSALYALSLGMGVDPLDEDELPYVYEGRGQLAAPSQCVTLCWPPFWHKEPATGISWRRILHGEQSFSLLRPLPVEGAVRAEHRILAVVDKGAGARGHPIHRQRSLRRDGRGADRDAALGRIPARRRRLRRLRRSLGADASARCRGRAERALRLSDIDAGRAALRQASRDYMPIHADPDIAREAGFARPISHGLNTFGLACRAALKTFAPRRPERLVSMAARFAAPAYPGDTIRVELFETANGLRFRARALERGVVVLDRGEIGLA